MPSRRSSLLVLAFAVAAATPFAAANADGTGRRGLAQAASPAVPPQCVNTGLGLQSSCAKELEVASSAFGLNPTADVSNIKVNTADLRAYLAKAPPPSGPCCEATAAFNNAYCSCSPAVLELAAGFTNNDVSQYREVASWLASKCKAVGKPFTLYIDNSCPKGKAP